LRGFAFACTLALLCLSNHSGSVLLR